MLASEIEASRRVLHCHSLSLTRIGLVAACLSNVVTPENGWWKRADVAPFPTGRCGKIPPVMKAENDDVVRTVLLKHFIESCYCLLFSPHLWCGSGSRPESRMFLHKIVESNSIPELRSFFRLSDEMP